jgi:hypothetical protein
MFKDFDEAQAQLWPDPCPACGYMAYIGMNEVKCVTVGSCKNFDQKESDRWVALRDELEVTEPRLSLPDLAEYVVQNAATGIAWPATPFDWHDHIESVNPIHDNGKGEWTYQLPANEAGACYIGDQHLSSNGITYAIVGVDRATDQITIAWDTRVQNRP